MSSSPQQQAAKNAANEAAKDKIPRRALLITPRGMRQLEDEYDFLWRKERPVVTRQVSDAAKLGDRSENAEYIYGKKRLREIDRRVRFLSKRIENLTIVDRLPANLKQVFFGAWLELEDDNEEIHHYRIVGEDEIDLPHNYISINAPLARGLMSKLQDDEVEIKLPKGAQNFYILSVSYQKPSWDTKTWYGEGEKSPHAPLSF